MPGAVEAAGGAVFALFAATATTGLELAALWWVAGSAVALVFIDVAVHRLPDRLTLPAYGGGLLLLGAAAAATGQPGRFGWAVLLGLGLAAGYLLLVLVQPDGMGLGDAKLALALGLVLGWFGGGALVLGAAAGFLLAGAYAVGLLVLRRAGRRDTIPHGPFMLVGALGAVVLWV